jgi:hypothetical protein
LEQEQQVQMVPVLQQLELVQEFQQLVLGLQQLERLQELVQLRQHHQR